jgi:hypothetical protein
MENSTGWETAKKIIDLSAGLSVIFTMVFIALQWNEMRGGAVDTHDLAVAAKSQAEATKSQADNTKTLAEAAKSQADNTKSLALAATNQVAKLDAGVRETHALAKATQDTLSEIRGNLIKEERPYLWPRPEAVAFEKGQPLRWNLHFVNYGKSPAIRAHTCVTLTYGADALSVASGYTEEDLIGQCKKPSPVAESESIAPPGDALFATGQSNVILADDDAIKFFKADFRVAIRALVTYEDVYGHHYKSLFCAAHLATDAVYTCQQGNEIK